MNEGAKAFIAAGGGDWNTICVGAVALAIVNGRVSSDAIREKFIVTSDKRVIGAALSYLVKCDVLIKVAYKASISKSCNSRPIMVYALSDDWRSCWLHSTSKLPTPDWLMDAVAAETSPRKKDIYDHMEALLEAVDELKSPLRPALQLRVDDARRCFDGLRKNRVADGVR